MEGTDLVLYKSSVVSDVVANGGGKSYNLVTSNVLNNMFVNVSQAQRTDGVTRYRKFFFMNKNASNETASNSRIWVSSRSTGGDYYRLKAGTDTDTQAEADDYTNWLGTGYLDAELAADSTTADVVFDAASGVYAGSMVRVSDGSSEEFLTVATGGVSWNGNTATIVFTTAARSTYASGVASLVSGVIDFGNIVCSSDSWVETSASGTYDESTYPIEVNNIGTVSDTWTGTFTGATTFTVTGTNTGSVGTGSTAADFSPINASAGGGYTYFILRAAGFGGTWTTGDTFTFTTYHSAAGFWISEIVPAGTAAYTNNVVGFKLYCEGA